MASISAPLPYAQIQPLPEPKEWCPTLRKINSYVLTILTTTLYFVALGICLSLGGVPIQPVEGGALGAIVGTILGVVFARLIKFQTTIGQYRIDTLKQVESAQVNPKALAALQNLQNFFAKPLYQFHQTYQNHDLHQLISRVTPNISPDRPDVLKVWEAFLKHLDKSKVLNADGEWIELDFSLELERLQKKEVAAAPVEWLNTSSSQLDEDLEQIEKLESVSFGKGYTATKEKFKEILATIPGSGIAVIRKKGTNEILGFSLLYPEGNSICLSGIARKPGATDLAIGKSLMKAIIDRYPPYQPMHLHVRQSNQIAIQLYKQFGFIESEVLKGYYPHGPRENGLLFFKNGNALNPL